MINPIDAKIKHDELVNKYINDRGQPRKYRLDKIEGFEQHHVVTKAECIKLGWSQERTDDGSNIIYVTPSEHFELHILRYWFMRDEKTLSGYVAHAATCVADFRGVSVYQILEDTPYYAELWEESQAVGRKHQRYTMQQLCSCGECNGEITIAECTGVKISSAHQKLCGCGCNSTIAQCRAKKTNLTKQQSCLCGCNLSISQCHSRKSSSSMKETKCNCGCNLTIDECRIKKATKRKHEQCNCGCGLSISKCSAMKRVHTIQSEMCDCGCKLLRFKCSASKTSETLLHKLCDCGCNLTVATCRASRAANTRKRLCDCGCNLTKSQCLANAQRWWLHTTKQTPDSLYCWKYIEQIYAIWTKEKCGAKLLIRYCPDNLSKKLTTSRVNRMLTLFRDPQQYEEMLYLHRKTDFDQLISSLK